MKKFFIILFVSIVATVMGGCLNLEGILPFLNKEPVIISKPIITATEDQLYLYQVEASDPNGDTLTYSFTIRPEGMDINSESGLISWIPANYQVGIHPVIVEISDGKYSVTQSFEIEVINVNNPPQILSHFPIDLNIGINEGDSIKFEIQVNDIDLNTTLNYQWLLNGKKASSSTDSGDGLKSSWIYSTSYGDYSQKRVKVLVSDGELQDYVEWNITINDITPPAQPTLNTVTSPTNISTQTLSGNKESNTSVWINGVEIISVNSDTTWSYNFELTEGENSISIISKDSVGNESNEIYATIILDTIAPAIPSLETVISPTNISTQILSGTKEANSSILINDTEVVFINSSVTWSYSFNLSEGENNISITSQDSAGNESGEVTAKITLDTISPTAPTLNGVITPTNISIQILSGNKEASSSIWLNGTEVVSLNSSTAWSYSYSLSEGTNNISVTSRDALSNESAAVNINITLDTITPTTPTLHDIVSPTNICRQLLSGNKEINTSVWINGVEVIPVNSNTIWSYNFELTEGENSISIISKDSVGNESNEIYTTIILDTIAPAIPSLETVISPTNISTQILSGTKEANTSIWIDGLEAVPVNPITTWSYSFNLSEGENNISITSRDAIGNESTAVTTDIVLDTIAPEAPTLDTVTSPTNISPQILSGTKETNTSVWINGTEVVSLNSSTAWSYSYSLSEGTNNISVTSRDALSNESAAVNINITLDTITPTTPTLHDIVSPTNICRQLLSGNKEINTSVWINGVEIISVNSETTWSYNFELTEGENSISIISKDSVGNESNEIYATIILDTIAPAIPSLETVISPTNISTQILSGTKETNTSVWINGTEVVSLNSSTAWSYSYSLSEGTNNISVTSRDAAGNESTPITTTIMLDTGAPAAPTLDAVVSPTNVSPQTLSGTKETNTSIWINSLEVVPVNPITTWTYDFNLSEGENNISITSQDSAGNESGEVTAKITLDTISPTVPTLNEVITPTNISIQTLSGTKEASSSIWINGAEVVPLDSLTNWSHSYNLSEGTNNISIASRDAVGNESSAIIATIEYDPNIYVDAANTTGIEDGTQTHPFNTITEGLIAVISGKSVMVAAGTYNEQLIINKSIILQGAEKESTTISGFEYAGNLITITADNVTISGFKIDGISATDVGIYSDSSSSIEILENIIQNQQDSGILYHSAVNDYSSGIYIYNNEIYSNSKYGIKVTGEGSGIIESNTIRKNTNGIQANNNASLEIKHNNINDNISVGILCRGNSSLLIWGNEITFNDYGIKVGVLSSDTTNPDIGGGTRDGVGQNKIAGNKSYGVSNKTTYNIMAKNNWWGDAAGPKYPYHTSSSGDWAYWSETGGDIIFEPYLTTEP